MSGGATTDDQTMACYAAMARDYAGRISRAEPDGDLRAFMAALPPGPAPILDWGCGPGNSAAMMQAEDLAVVATDASPEMAALAAELGVSVRVEPFEALGDIDCYRGVRANFSLLHAPRETMPSLLTRAARALLPNGVLHLGMKCGAGVARDSLGRRFTYWSPDALEGALHAAGLTPLSRREGSGLGLDARMEPYVISLSRKDRTV